MTSTDATPTAADLAAERDALLARLAELDEQLPEGVPGQHPAWPPMPADWSRQIDQALDLLDRALRQAARHRTPATRLALVSAVDRALADPRTGYLRRLRGVRSATIRERLAGGVPLEELAAEMNLSPRRVRSLANNNVRYSSAEREAVLASLAAERAARAAARRATAKADRTASLAAAAEARRLERVALGRPLLARLAAGEARESLMGELGWSRQRLAKVLADAARAVEAETQATGGVVAVGAHDENETAPLAA